MSSSQRFIAICVLGIVLLAALHVQLNLGGWPRFISRLRTGDTVRGELVVGHLPVT